MPREDPKKNLLQDMTLPVQRSWSSLATEEKKEILTLYYSQFAEETSQEEGKSKGYSPEEAPLFATEKERRSSGIVLGLLVSMTNGFVC